MHKCPACYAELHSECLWPMKLEEVSFKGAQGNIIVCCCDAEEAANDGVIEEVLIGTSTTDKRGNLPQGANKSASDVRDPTSTGRKRAVKLKPIIEGMVCEWANLRSAGGGVFPIVGCEGIILTTQKGNDERTGNVHHGPDKSTLNNSDENLHRVCGKCHNRWHELNNPEYNEPRPKNGGAWVPVAEFFPHDKHSLATDRQKQRDAEWWALPKGKRPNYSDYVHEVTGEEEVA